MSYTPGKRILGEQSKAKHGIIQGNHASKSRKEIMQGNHARKSCRVITLCKSRHGIYSLSPKNHRNNRFLLLVTAPNYRSLSLLSDSILTCCRQASRKKCDMHKLFHLAKIAVISNNRLKHVIGSRQCVHANNVHPTMSNDRFNQTFVSIKHLFHAMLAMFTCALFIRLPFI